MSSEWELSKENVQPIKQGRRFSNLNAALQSNVDQTTLKREKQDFEAALRTYSGEDPLEVWYNYVLWTEQAFPKGGSESPLCQLLERCIRQFNDSEEYKNDQRLVDMWIRYANLSSDSEEVFKFMNDQGIGNQVSCFYENWAWLAECGGHTKKADSIYQLGISRNAKPLEQLTRKHERFQNRVMRGLVGQEEEDMETSHTETRTALGRLKTVGKKHQAPVSRIGGVGHGSGIGVPLQDRVSNQKPGLGFQIFSDENAAAAYVPDRTGEWKEIPKPTNMNKENYQKPGVWTSAKVPQKSTAIVPVSSKPSFSIHVEENEDQPIMTPRKTSVENQVLSARKPPKSVDPLQNVRHVAETAEPVFIPMYCKNKIYCGIEEFSFEELRALRCKKKRKMAEERRRREQEREIAAHQEELLRKQEDLKKQMAEFEMQQEQFRMEQAAIMSHLRETMKQQRNQFDTERQIDVESQREQLERDIQARMQQQSESVSRQFVSSLSPQSSGNVCSQQDGSNTTQHDQSELGGSSLNFSTQQSRATATMASQMIHTDNQPNFQAASSQLSQAHVYQNSQGILSSAAQPRFNIYQDQSLPPSGTMVSTQPWSSVNQNQPSLPPSGTMINPQSEFRIHQDDTSHNQGLQTPQSEFRIHQDQTSHNQGLQINEDQQSYSQGQQIKQEHPASLQGRLNVTAPNNSLNTSCRTPNDRSLTHNVTGSSGRHSGPENRVSNVLVLDDESLSIHTGPEDRIKIVPMISVESSSTHTGLQSRSISAPSPTVNMKEAMNIVMGMFNASLDIEKNLGWDEGDASLPMVPELPAAGGMQFAIFDENTKPDTKHVTESTESRQECGIPVKSQGLKSRTESGIPVQSLGKKSTAESGIPVQSLKSMAESGTYKRKEDSGLTTNNFFEYEMKMEGIESMGGDEDYTIAPVGSHHSFTAAARFASTPFSGKNETLPPIPNMSNIQVDDKTSNSTTASLPSLSQTNKTDFGSVTDNQNLSPIMEGSNEDSSDPSGPSHSSRQTNTEWTTGSHHIPHPITEEEEEGQDRNVVDVSLYQPLEDRADMLSMSVYIDTSDPFNSDTAKEILDRLTIPIYQHPLYHEVKRGIPSMIPDLTITLGMDMYEIVERIGKGGFAKVYSARRESCDTNFLNLEMECKEKLVALKFVEQDPARMLLNIQTSKESNNYHCTMMQHTGGILEESFQDPDKNKSMIPKVQKPPCPWEFYICTELHSRLGRLNSHVDVRPSMMSIEKGYFFPDASCLMTEYCEYGSLLDIVNKFGDANKSQEFLTMYLTIELLHMVEQLHQCNIIHGDFKPDNLLVRRFQPLPDSDDPAIVFGGDQRPLMLIDFGMSIDMTKYPAGTTFMAKIKTESFMCIEMQTDRPWTYQTDLFGLAGTIHVLLFGQYMKVYQEHGEWKITQSVVRKFNQSLWKRIFFTLLNIRSCDEIPDLTSLRRECEEYFISSLLSTYNRSINKIMSKLNRGS